LPSLADAEQLLAVGDGGFDPPASSHRRSHLADQGGSVSVLPNAPHQMLGIWATSTMSTYRSGVLAPAVRRRYYRFVANQV
jgi:hypothetical protein